MHDYEVLKMTLLSYLNSFVTVVLLWKSQPSTFTFFVSSSFLFQVLRYLSIRPLKLPLHFQPLPNL